MQFEKGYMYHIFNQGNNRRKLFYKKDNYIFYLQKIKNYISPYADIIAWCLMPNHFHLMVYVREEFLCVDSQSFTLSETLTSKAQRGKNKRRTLNESIGIMLRSYTRAINKQEGFTGALFRKQTKAQCLNCPNCLTPSFFIREGVTQINIQDPEKEYPQICFDYIHDNPVKAKLVKCAVDWKFSSALDYENSRDGGLVNKEIGRDYLKNNKKESGM